MYPYYLLENYYRIACERITNNPHKKIPGTIKKKKNDNLAGGFSCVYLTYLILQYQCIIITVDYYYTIIIVSISIIFFLFLTPRPYIDNIILNEFFFRFLSRSPAYEDFMWNYYFGIYFLSSRHVPTII